MPLPSAYAGAVDRETAGEGHFPWCDQLVWYRCDQDGLFQATQLGRGENRCPDCGMMAARAWCVCGDVEYTDEDWFFDG